MSAEFKIMSVGKTFQVSMDDRLLVTVETWREVDLICQLLKGITQRYGTLTERYDYGTPVNPS